MLSIRMTRVCSGFDLRTGEKEPINACSTNIGRCRFQKAEANSKSKKNYFYQKEILLFQVIALDSSGEWQKARNGIAEIYYGK